LLFFLNINNKYFCSVEVVFNNFVNFCDTDASDVSSVTENCGAIPQIDYQELLEATQSWAKHNILGKGGFGTVFKGNWKNTQVAVKRIEQVMMKKGSWTMLFKFLCIHVTLVM